MSLGTYNPQIVSGTWPCTAMNVLPSSFPTYITQCISMYKIRLFKEATGEHGNRESEKE